MRIEADYLIVGSGLAGLFFALKAAERGSVVLITKEEPRESNTSYAQGGIASVMDGSDSFEQHVQDTLEAGDGLCDPEVVAQVVRKGPGMIQELIELGTRFTRRKSGALSLGREGGHSTSRVVHAEDLTGREVIRALLAAIESKDGVQLYPYHMAVELIIDGEGRCRGAHALDLRGGNIVELIAPVTLLATGGCGQVYLHTTNPSVATGDGVAMAYRAGACVGNLEFVQFHPTMLYDLRGGSFLISEAVRGYGGVLVNDRGESFVDAYHPMGSLATRDVVARAIVSEMKDRGWECVFLDVTGKDGEETRRRFPNIYQHCLGLGIDMTREPIPVVPAAHYMCGGVRTDRHGRTDLWGLYAAGEVAMTGFHGANRLASNSLLEALVFARRVLAHARAPKRPGSSGRPLREEEPGRPPAAAGQLARLRDQVRRCTWENVGIVRSDAGLAKACQELGSAALEVEALCQRCAFGTELFQLRNMATVAELIARAAQMRRESRGGHFNRDYPERDDANWRRYTLMGMQGPLAEPPQAAH